MFMQVIRIALASAGTDEPIDYVASAYWKVLIGLHVACLHIAILVCIWR